MEAMPSTHVKGLCGIPTTPPATRVVCLWVRAAAARPKKIQQNVT
jgi:hypothetical protein